LKRLMTIAGPSSFAVWLAMPRAIGCVFAAEAELAVHIAQLAATTATERKSIPASPANNLAIRKIGPIGNQAATHDAGNF